MSAKRLILASASPRRRELLAKMGYEFICHPADVDETVDAGAREAVEILAVRKAKAVVAEGVNGVIIASDTLVSIDNRALGKPADKNDAKNMLCALSGREHEVFTGVCVMDTETGKIESRAVRTGVKFREITDEEIEAYVATGEPMDKAGAYAIQGGAGKFVEKLDGTFENVMGFPTDAADEMLKRFLAED